jgi:hypothetical protein
MGSVVNSGHQISCCQSLLSAYVIVVMKTIMLEVCGACQNDCPNCAHRGMISAYKGYHLSIEGLESFIQCTIQSNYFFKTIHVHGMGEPLLWKHFNTGIKLLKKAGIADNIIVTTNGIAIDRINDETWEYIDTLEVSLYENCSNRNDLKELAERHKGKVNFGSRSGFRSKPTRRYRTTLPVPCLCSGPMFVENKIFLHCGPPVFDASMLSGIDIFSSHDLYVELAPLYLDKFEEKKIGNIGLCNYCWANENIDLPRYPHGHIPSRIIFALKCWYFNEFRDGVKRLKRHIQW